MARPVEAKEPEHLKWAFDDEQYREIIRGSKDHADRVRLIRWIPATERLPEICEQLDGIGIGRSRAVLCCVSGSVYPQLVRRLQTLGPDKWWIDGSRFYSENMLDVSHWAELPAPPSTSRESA